MNSPGLSRDQTGLGFCVECPLREDCMHKASVGWPSRLLQKSFVWVFAVAHDFLLKWGWSFPLQIQQMFLFSQLPHLQCKLSCQGAAIFPSVLIVLPLIHPFSFASLFPKWPPTPAMTLFAKLTGAPTVIGAASGKSTLTPLINWISWPHPIRVKMQRCSGIVLFVWTYTHTHARTHAHTHTHTHTHALKSAARDSIREEAFYPVSYFFIIAKSEQDNWATLPWLVCVVKVERSNKMEKLKEVWSGLL